MDFPLDLENQKNIENLIQVINQDECCIFIGSGLSIPAGYPRWVDLIAKLKQAVEIRGGTNSLDPSMSNWSLTDYYREYLGDAHYFQLVTSLFSPDGKEVFRPVHQVILEIPFHAYITTNYDCCLENAAIFLRKHTKTHFYPELDSSYLREGHIFHVHGFLDPNDTTGTIGTIVLTERDYERAYRPSTVLPTFLAQLFFFHTIVFIGYSMSDDDLIKIFQSTKLELELQGKYELEKGIGTRRQNKHYIFLHDDNNERINVFREMELLPIIYSGETERHSGLQDILNYIHRHTANLEYPQLDINRQMFEGEDDD